MRIDTLGTQKHIRHVVKEAKPDGTVVTMCGRTVKYYSEADTRWGPTSYFFDNGERFSTPCPHCLPDQMEARH